MSGKPTTDSKHGKRIIWLLLCLLLIVAGIGLSDWNQFGQADAASIPDQSFPLDETGEMAAADDPPFSNAADPDPVDPDSPFVQTLLDQERQVDVRHQRVFRLVLNEGHCSLEAAEELTGDFRPVRSLPSLHPGMLRCRLLSANGEVVAERRVHPPDHVCAVLDPHDGESPPQVTLLSGLGPQVFQVRFPSAIEAAQLEIVRVGSFDGRAGESLLTTIDLTP